MPLPLYHAEVTGFRDLTHDVREIYFRLSEPPQIAFKAGQFVSFEIMPPGGQRPVVRPYSIASPPRQSDTLTLLLNLVPNGPGSNYLFGLRPGDKVQFKGPAGAFYLRDVDKNLLFVATGTGIAPIWSMLFHLFDQPYAGRATLFWGLRSQRDLYYQDELETLARTHPNFTFVTTLSRPEPGWTGVSGRVTRLVEERVTSVAGTAVYLCGNSGMIKDVTGIINSKGLAPVYREKYYDDTGAPDD